MNPILQRSLDLTETFKSDKQRKAVFARRKTHTSEQRSGMKFGWMFKSGQEPLQPFRRQEFSKTSESRRTRGDKSSTLPSGRRFGWMPKSLVSQMTRKKSARTAFKEKVASDVRTTMGKILSRKSY